MRGPFEGGAREGTEEQLLLAPLQENSLLLLLPGIPSSPRRFGLGWGLGYPSSEYASRIAT